jgi:putative tricarboxylic transport membrane protein
MIELVYTFLLGIIAGIFSGLAPGVSIAMGFMLFLPLIPVDALNLTMYTMVVGLGTQFFGSQSVLYYRIPGESSSFPTLIESTNFDTTEKIRNAIQVTTWGSLVASVIAIMLLGVALTTNILDWLHIPIEAKGVIYFFLILLSVFSTRSWLVNLLILIFASLIAFYEDIAPMTGILPTFYFNSMLSLIIVFAMQLVWQKPDIVISQDIAKKSDYKFTQWLPTYVKYGAIGTMFGLIPQLGATLSSYTVYLWEKFKKAPAINRVAAAETTNNGAVVFQWMPLFLFGIPITGSEIMLVSHFNMHGLNFDFLREQAWTLMLAVAISALVYTKLCLVTNKVFYNNLGKLISNRLFSILIAIVSMGLFFWGGGYTLEFMLIHLAVFIPVSWIVAKFQVNLISVIVGLMLSNQILFTFFQLNEIYNY